jgi:hypothetical protein
VNARKENKLYRLLEAVAIFLLIVNGLSAIGGGALLMLSPTGRLMGLDVSLLNNSPFQTFFIPGFLLFVFNGISSIAIAVATIRGLRRYPLLIMYQGVTSAVWILAEINMTHTLNFLHYICGGIGIVLFIIGWDLKK